jgi:hypothetical protein
VASVVYSKDYMSQIERCYGPLDVMRAINYDVLQYDELAAMHPDPRSSEYKELDLKLQNLSRQTPYIDEAVTVYGPILGVGMDSDRTIGDFIYDPNLLSDPASGTYQGMTMHVARDLSTGEEANRIVHKVKTGEERYRDAFYNQHHTEFFDYVLVEGSDLLPLRPRDAHSLIDLSNDKVTQELDLVAYREDLTPDELVRSLGSLMARCIINNPDDFVFNQQRVSYLNSLELIENIRFVTRDFVWSRREDYLSGEFMKLNNSAEDHAEGHYLYGPGYSPTELPLTHFDLLPGYDTQDGQILYGGPLELFVAAETVEGMDLLLPFSRVLDVRQGTQA